MARPTLHTNNLPTVALVGRVNVGKSTLFNKLVEEHKAIVSTIPGTTRTNNEGVVLWRGKEIRLIDTGGLTFAMDVPLEEDIIAQSEQAIKEADLVLFITDAQAGILPQEIELAKRLQRKQTPVVVIGNKADNTRVENSIDHQAYAKLNLGDPFFISGTNGRNVGDMLDMLYTKLQRGSVRPKKSKDDKPPIRITLIGKPNVGKSSLFNKLIGQERVIVSDMAHTTREPYDTRVIYKHKQGKRELQQHMIFVDTAGIRRKANVKGFLERAGISKSITSVDTSDIVLFIIDGSEPISSQDKQLGGLVEKRGKSVLILVNKWDLAEDNSEANQKHVRAVIHSHFPHLKFAPILFVSGKTGLHVHKIFPLLMQIWQARHTEVPVKALEHFLRSVVEKHKPSRGKGTRHPKILGIRQLATAPPTIELVIKYRTSLHSSYTHFVENKLREQFDFTGTPIIIRLRKQRR